MKFGSLVKGWIAQLRGQGGATRNPDGTVSYSATNPWRLRILLIAGAAALVGGFSGGVLYVDHHAKPKTTQHETMTSVPTTGSSGQPTTTEPSTTSPTKSTTTKPKSSTSTKSSTSSNSTSAGISATKKSSSKSSGSSGGKKSGGGSSGGGGTTSSMKLGIPTYWYPPASYDSQLDSAGGSKVGFAIANVDSGPGTGGTESNFQTMINNERSAGIKVYGYVYTSYGSRSISDVEADIDSWYSWYNLDGILLDEAPGTGWTSPQKTYYQTIYTYIKAKTGANVHGTTVMLNPGTNTDEYAMSVSDIVCDYEDVETNYASFSFPVWTKNYSASRFCNIVYDSAGVSQMESDISLAKSRNIGYVYVTTDSGGNPYDTLPSNPFWTDELGAL